MSGVLFGSFDLDGHSSPPVGYYVIGRQLGTVQVTQALSPVARYEGEKKQGQYIGSRKIKLQVKVVGSSRSDLEAKLDALYVALNIPQQHLTIHTGSTRYFVADAVYAPADTSIGQILAVVVPIDFICQQPYAQDTSASSYASGVQQLAISGGGYPFSFTAAGGGTVFARPIATITNRRQIISTSIATTALVNGTPYTQITVNPIAYALYVGDTLTLTSGANTQTVVVSTNVAALATTIFVTSFTANFSYPIGTFVVLDIHWTAVTLQQTTDNQYWSVSGASNPGITLCGIYSETLTFTSDPNIGISVVDSYYNYLPPLNFTGSPITINPTTTAFLLTISAPSIPMMDISLSWYARYLS